MISEPAGNSMSPTLNAAFAPLIGDVLQAVAQRDQVERAVVLDDRDRPGAGDGARRRHVGGEQRRRRVEDRLVLDRLDVDVVGHAHRPGAVVVGRERRIRIGLLLEQRLGQRPVRLVQLDDVGAGREGAFLDLDLRGGAMHFDGLHGAAGSRRDRPASDRAGPPGITNACGGLSAPRFIAFADFL